MLILSNKHAFIRLPKKSKIITNSCKNVFFLLKNKRHFAPFSKFRPKLFPSSIKNPAAKTRADRSRAKTKIRNRYIVKSPETRPKEWVQLLLANGSFIPSLQSKGYFYGNVSFKITNVWFVILMLIIKFKRIEVFSVLSYSMFLVINATILTKSACMSCYFGTLLVEVQNLTVTCFRVSE